MRHREVCETFRAQCAAFFVLGGFEKRRTAEGSLADPECRRRDVRVAGSANTKSKLLRRRLKAYKDAVMCNANHATEPSYARIPSTRCRIVSLNVSFEEEREKVVVG